MTTNKVRPIPDGYHVVTPFVIVKGAAQFIDFMKEAFQAVEIARVGEDGAIGHAEVRIGDSVVMLFDSKQEWPETPAFLRLYVEECDATYQQALKSGATSVTKPTNMPWGDRVARVRDPLGNLILLANSKLVGRCPQFWLRLQPFSHQNRRSFEKTDDLPHERHFANSIAIFGGS
jgi:uncharacterized glyoxalase superfamily protein PhnB